jgi:hypothetical protein
MPNAQSDQMKLDWFLVALYLADVAGILDDDKKVKLVHLAEQAGMGMSWKESIEEDLALDREFFTELLEVCQLRLGIRDSLCFILRGLGCPSPEMRVFDALGPGDV